MDSFPLHLVTPRLDAIFPGGGAILPLFAQPAVMTCGLLLQSRSLRLLEGTCLASADFLNEPCSPRVLLFFLLTCCRRDG